MQTKGNWFWKQHFCLLGLCLIQHILPAQIPWFRLYGKEYGLSQAQVNDLVRDARGRIWLASDQGLQCFDGHGFQTILPAGDTAAGLKSGPITSLHCDAQNRLWIGYYHSGVSVWDLESGAFHHYNPGRNRSQRVLNIQSGPAGKVWVFLHDTVWLEFDASGLGMRLLKPSFPIGATPLFLRHAVPGLRAGEWFLGSNRGLYRVKLAGMAAEHHPFVEADGSRPGVRNMVNGLLRQGERVWVSTWGGGLLAWELKESKYSGAFTYQEVPRLSGATNVVHRILPMGDKLLITTPDRGAGVFDPASGTFVFPGPEIPNLGGLSLSYAACQDADQGYWIGHQAGLLRFDPTRSYMRHFDIPPTPDPAMQRLNFPLCIQRRGNALFTASAHGSGVYKHDATAGGLQRIYPMPGLQGNTSTMVFNLEWESETVLLVNSGHGLFRLDTETGRWSPFRLPDGKQAFCRSIRRHGDSLLLGFGDGRIGLYLIASRRFRIWEKSAYTAAGLNYWNGPVLDICADSRGAIYAANEKGISVIASGGNRLLQFGYEKGEAWRLLRIVNWLLPASDGRIWFSGEEGGIAAIDPAKGYRVVQSISEQDGLSERFVASLCGDAKGRIWGLCGAALFCYDPSLGNLQQWNQHNGLAQEPAEWSRLKILDGELFFSVLNGWNRIPMAQLPFASGPARPFISAWRKAGGSWQLHAAPDLQWIAEAGGAIRLSVQPLSDGLHTQYRYRFGADMAWINGEGDRQILLGSMAPGSYRLEVSVRNLNHGWTPALSLGEFRVLPPFYRRAWFLLGVLVLVAGSLFWYFRMQQQRRQLAATYEKKVMQLQAEALRSQMNPHFLFNSLNSIRYYIEQNDREQAAHYLQRFSRLMRAVLNHARSETVSLEEELAVVSLYTELEHMRFQKAFAVDIQIDPASDPAMIRVPPMLLQPYVENAIWHGLMHREDGGRLVIRVSGPTERTSVEIADNGVGREQAAMMRSKTASGEKSHGTRITRERIDVHNRLGISHIDVITQDIDADAGGGTRVVLQIQNPPVTTA